MAKSVIEKKLKQQLNKFDLDSEAILDILYSEKNMELMKEELNKDKDIEDGDEVYCIAFKIANIPVKAVNEKIKTYMKKHGVKERKIPFVK